MPPRDKSNASQRDSYILLQAGASSGTTDPALEPVDDAILAEAATQPSPGADEGQPTVAHVAAMPMGNIDGPAAFGNMIAALFQPPASPVASTADPFVSPPKGVDLLLESGAITPCSAP